MHNDVVKESLVHYHNQQFGHSIEAESVNGALREVSDLTSCQNQQWCSITQNQVNSAGYHLEFDVSHFDEDQIQINVDVYADRLCVSANSSAQNDSRQTSGSEFGMYHIIQLPEGVIPQSVTAHVTNHRLRVWVPRSQPLSHTEEYAHETH